MLHATTGCCPRQIVVLGANREQVNHEQRPRANRAVDPVGIVPSPPRRGVVRVVLLLHLAGYLIGSSPILAMPLELTRCLLVTISVSASLRLPAVRRWQMSGKPRLESHKGLDDACLGRDAGEENVPLSKLVVLALPDVLSDWPGLGDRGTLVIAEGKEKRVHELHRHTPYEATAPDLFSLLRRKSGCSEVARQG